MGFLRLETEKYERIGFDFFCDVALRITEARKKKGLTQKELAEKAGMKLSRLIALEGVKTRVQIGDVEKLSKVLDVTVNWLIDAHPNSPLGECLYLIWFEGMESFKLYQRSTSTRLAFLQNEERIRKSRVGINPRQRTFVELVGVPVGHQELMDRYGKYNPEDENVFPDK